MKIPTLIVDDEPLARQLVASLLKDDKEIHIARQCSNGYSALTAITTHHPQLMFLDVQMPGLSGFELIEKIPAAEMPYIIFVTAYDQYALRAFEVHALDYLLKPFDKERFYKSLHHAKRIIQHQSLRNSTEKIMAMSQSLKQSVDKKNITKDEIENEPYLEEIIIRDSGRLIAAKIINIIRLEAANQYVRIHTTQGSYLLSKSLDQLQKKLDPKHFFRIHRSAIVHANFILEVRTARNGTCDILLTTGESLKLSRSRKYILPQLLKRCP
jgi:two-component system LytT family response regulator